MAKSSPEKLAAALRANLKRRKQSGQTGSEAGGMIRPAPKPSRPDSPPKPPKNSA